MFLYKLGEQSMLWAMACIGDVTKGMLMKRAGDTLMPQLVRYDIPEFSAIGATAVVNFCWR